MAFSRDPSTGLPQPMIDLVLDAQGEDVVSGRRTPEPKTAIARALPAIAAELGDILERLEREFGDVQDVEFTIEDGKFWILQTRAAKRTPRAALRFAIDLVHEGLITRREALAADGRHRSCRPGSGLAGLAPSEPVAAGIGRVRRHRGRTRRVRLRKAPSGSRPAGDPVILMRPDTSTADVAGFAIAAGIVTSVGARTAHAALVARQMGKPCIVGCGGMTIDVAADRAQLGGTTISASDWITIDGDSGNIYLGRCETRRDAARGGAGRNRKLAIAGAWPRSQPAQAETALPREPAPAGDRPAHSCHHP